MVSPAHIEVRDLLDLTDRVAAVTGAFDRQSAELISDGRSRRLIESAR